MVCTGVFKRLLFYLPVIQTRHFLVSVSQPRAHNQRFRRDCRQVQACNIKWRTMGNAAENPTLAIYSKTRQVQGKHSKSSLYVHIFSLAKKNPIFIAPYRKRFCHLTTQLSRGIVLMLVLWYLVYFNLAGGFEHGAKTRAPRGGWRG